MSLNGTKFFYPNPLASMGQHDRSPWFSCACCISNMTRFLPSVPGYVYAQNKNNLYVNLFMSNSSTIKLPAGKVQLTQTTNYPWDGNISLKVDVAKPTAFALHIRIPGWAEGKPVPGELYTIGEQPQKVTMTINGKPATLKIDKGYAVFQRTWQKGDKITVELPMQPQHIYASQNVKADEGRFAIQYGPVVYCLEGWDNKDSLVQNIIVDKNAPMQVSYAGNVLNVINRITMPGSGQQTVTAIPYYAWDNRGPGEMEVWIPYTQAAARPQPAPTIAYTSKVTASIRSRSIMSVHDQLEPADSKDNSVPYFHWWPKKNTTEWVQYDFSSEQTVSSCKVYWFDDGPWGGCRIPAKWTIYYKKDGQWLPVKNTTDYEIAKDKYNAVSFEAVKTTALKLEVQLPVEYATGIHEWVVE
jgi:DUF1680 family protein